uniref:Uncharacterized protein ycf35 n=1 Tax=Tolypiocladia glomerulata TaxID=860646 RepID=A0A1Z1MV67_9FLOR|nr:hypothetical protein [Tolypiocladia glomerulata]ARW69665.1 hypothetical protein [Tolypiocladia glomerulata]
MSHFSKIKTSITDSKVLKKTLNDLSFVHKSFFEDNNIASDSSLDRKEIIFVYDSYISESLLPCCSFEWNDNEYVIVVDLSLWNLDIDFHYFTERLLQQYAYNIVIDQGYNEGFHCIDEKVYDNGSISLILQKF